LAAAAEIVIVYISVCMKSDGSSACGFAVRKRAMDPRRRE
jgi:hypothetical protein